MGRDREPEAVGIGILSQWPSREEFNAGHGKKTGQLAPLLAVGCHGVDLEPTDLSLLSSWTRDGGVGIPRDFQSRPFHTPNEALKVVKVHREVHASSVTGLLAHARHADSNVLAAKRSRLEATLPLLTPLLVPLLPPAFPIVG